MFRVCADFILFWFLGLKRLFLLFKIYKKIFYSQWVFCKILAISTQLIKLKWSHSKNGQFVGSLKLKDIHILGPYWLWNQTDLLNLWNYLRVVTKYGIFSASVGGKKKKKKPFLWQYTLISENLSFSLAPPSWEVNVWL